jgi:hypothetical protein
MSHRRAAVVLLALGLSACGGSGGGGGGGSVNFSNFQSASDILGQTTTTGTSINNGGTTNQVGLAFPEGHLASGSLYVADNFNNRVLGWFDVPTGLGQPADFVLGQIDFTSNTAGLSATKVDRPRGCWVASGVLFVADSNNGRVLIYSGTPTSNVAAALALGKSDLTATTPTSGQAGLLSAANVCVAANRIVVADSGNNRVMIWNGIPVASGADAQLVVGQPDFATTSPGTTAAKMDSPSAVWTDGTRLVVSETGNHRVLIWSTFPTVNGQAADLVVGQPDFTTNTGGVGAQKLSFPRGVTSDGAQLFVADQLNHRVLIFSPFPTTSNPAATGVLGQSNFTNVAENDDDQDGASDATATARTMRTPRGVSILGNRLYVVDSINHRILVFTGS